jgi:hypothetical protein
MISSGVMKPRTISTILNRLCHSPVLVSPNYHKDFQIFSFAPFQQWGLDFIGQFSQSSIVGHIWILEATDYFTRWIEAVALKTSSSPLIIRLLEENILTRFGVPQKLTTDNASVFRSVELLAFCSQYGITLAHAANYYPQGNDLAESSNKNIIMIIRKQSGITKELGTVVSNMLCGWT